MRSLLTPFLLGAFATGLLVYAGALALAIVAGSAGWGALHVALGPITFVAVERAGATTATTFGSGLGLAALAGGALNAVAAAVLRRLRGGGPIA